LLERRYYRNKGHNPNTVLGSGSDENDFCFSEAKEKKRLQEQRSQTQKSALALSPSEDCWV
jgi:hypothetical protein